MRTLIGFLLCVSAFGQGYPAGLPLGSSSGGPVTGCAASGASGVVQASNGSGGCQSTNITNDGTTTTFGAGSATAGGYNLHQGTAASTVAGYVGINAPGTVATPYQMYLPTAPSTGFLLNTDTAGQDQLTIVAIVPAANGGAGTVNGALKGNGSGAVSQAACADLSNAGTGCSGSAAVRIWTCTVITGDPGAASSVLANDNDSPVACSNNLGTDITITTVAAYADAASLTVTPILTAGSGTSILTGALTAGTAAWAAGTLNGTPVLHSFSGGGATCSSTPCTIDSNITVAGGSAKYLVVKITGTY